MLCINCYIDSKRNDDGDVMTVDVFLYRFSSCKGDLLYGHDGGGSVSCTN